MQKMKTDPFMQKMKTDPFTNDYKTKRCKRETWRTNQNPRAEFRRYKPLTRISPIFTNFLTFPFSRISSGSRLKDLLWSGIRFRRGLAQPENHTHPTRISNREPLEIREQNRKKI
jgi:hypothetical protein